MARFCVIGVSRSSYDKALVSARNFGIWSALITAPAVELPAMHVSPVKMLTTGRIPRWFLLVLFFIFNANFGLSQSDPNGGILPFSLHVGGQYDVLDPATGNVMLSIPMRSKAGKVPFAFNLGANFNVWVAYNSGTYYWEQDPTSNAFSMRGVPSGGLGASLQYTTTHPSCNGNFTSQSIDSNFFVVEPNGTRHHVSNALAPYYGACTTIGSGTYSTTDGSGYTVIAVVGNPPQYTVYDRSGKKIGTGASTGTVTDADGTTMSTSATFSGSGSTLARTTTYTDTLGQVAARSTEYLNRYLGTSLPDTYTYTDVNDSPQTAYVYYTSYHHQTNFGCTGIVDRDLGTNEFPTSIVLADGETFNLSYEQTAGFSGSITGRLAKITLPSGGYVAFSYSGSGGTGGTNCAPGAIRIKAIPSVTRTIYDGKGPTSQWNYVPSAELDSYGNFYVTATDPALNTTTYHYHWPNSSPLLTETATADSTSHVFSKTVICYNGHNSSETACIAPQTQLDWGPSDPGPLKQRDVYTAIGSASPALTETKYDYNATSAISLGNEISVARYAVGTYPPSGSPVSTVTSTYANVNGVTCGPVSVHIVDHSCSITTTNAGTTVSQVLYTYNAGGHATVTSNLVGGSKYLTSQATYNTNGTQATFTDVNGAITTYSYNGSGQCNGLLLTNTTAPSISGVQLTTSQTWDCDGGVLTSSTDENGKTTSYSYADSNGQADPLWRVRKVTAPLTDSTNSVTNFTYGPTTTESSMLFNGGSSIADTVTTTDGLGRTILVQKKQSPSSSSYDTVQYGYDPVGNQNFVSLPCSATLGSGCSIGTTTTFDPLRRPLHAQDAGTGTQDFTYTEAGSKFDAYRTSGPAPAGENTKRRQLEYDGLGRLTSVCEVTGATGSGNCAQQSVKTGFFTTYAYDTPTINSVVYNRTTVVQNAQATGNSQTRTFLYDLLGRLISEVNPETGTTQYVYDAPTGTCASLGFTSYPGDLVARYDANGNAKCLQYDSIHRILSSYYYGPNATPSNHFNYDLGSAGGFTIKDAKGKLSEAYTCTAGATTCVGNVVSDEVFSYSPRGEIVEYYQSSPHSGGAYHPTTSYWDNGSVQNLWMSGLPSLAYTPDGEGRPYSITPNSGQLPLTSAFYNPASQPTAVNFGSADHDDFTYDPNTGRMKTYKFTVGSNNQLGTPTWNPNGTLKSLVIADPWTSANNQTCNYGYDDLSRLASANCGTAWSQTFTYDPFGNISKSGSSSFQAGYTPASGPPNNRIQSVPGCTPVWNPATNYDAMGNLLFDCTHHYTWDAEGRVATIDSVSFTYDAFDRNVEQNRAGTYFQMVYAPAGQKLAIMKGQVIQQAVVNLPGGAVAEYLSWGLSHYRHPDWLGSDRLASSSSNHALISGAAYAPFGEPYAQLSGTNGELSFAGGNKDTLWLEYDFLRRQLDPTQGRWISPDPAGMSAADPNNPQSWNRYSYVLNNPLSNIDLDGLECVWDDGSYDSQDDPNTGNSGLCFGQGGTWVDHGYFADIGASDWSSSPDQSLEWTVSEIQQGYVSANVFGFAPPDVSYGGTPPVYLGAANDGSWWSALKHSPWVVSWIFPIGPVPGVAGVGPAGSFAWNPATKTLCGSIGAGASVGDNLAVGPVVGRTLKGRKASPSQIDQVFNGWSANGGINVPIGPVPVGPGIQGSANGSGAVYGPTVGVAGASVSSTYAVCASF